MWSVAQGGSQLLTPGKVWRGDEEGPTGPEQSVERGCLGMTSGREARGAPWQQVDQTNMFTAPSSRITSSTPVKGLRGHKHPRAKRTLEHLTRDVTKMEEEGKETQGGGRGRSETLVPGPGGRGGEGTTLGRGRGGLVLLAWAGRVRTGYRSVMGTRPPQDPGKEARAGVLGTPGTGEGDRRGCLRRGSESPRPFAGRRLEPPTQPQGAPADGG